MSVGGTEVRVGSQRRLNVQRVGLGLKMFREVAVGWKDEGMWLSCVLFSMQEPAAGPRLKEHDICIYRLGKVAKGSSFHLRSLPQLIQWLSQFSSSYIFALMS